MTAKQVSLEEAIRERARRRSLTGSLDGMRCANGYLFAGGPARNTLYVGIGHGLDALLALTDGEVEKAVGVDPFIAEHGNDEDDYETLKRLIAELGLSGRFLLYKEVIQDYQPPKGDTADLIVINDVLHHIFETAEPLRQSTLYPHAVALFGRLQEIASPDTRLVIGDVSRHGLRPLLGRLGLLHPWIDYSTKQNWREWDAAARQAGWERTGISNYTPYRARRLALLFQGPVARYTLCNKYFLTYRSGDR